MTALRFQTGGWGGGRHKTFPAFLSGVFMRTNPSDHTSVRKEAWCRYTYVYQHLISMPVADAPLPERVHVGTHRPGVGIEAWCPDSGSDHG